jgi:hypothetical protein
MTSESLRLDLSYEQQGDAGVACRGFGVSSEIEPPGETVVGFSRAILDLRYGRFV